MGVNFCPNGHIYSERKFGNVCPYCNAKCTKKETNMKHKITIEFPEGSLKTIHESGQKAAIIRHSGVPDDIVVTWVCFSPFMLNDITWDENCSIYTTTTSIESTHIANILYEENASPSIRNEFTAGPLVSPKKTSCYYASNYSEDFPELTIGLAQTIKINDAIYEKQPNSAFAVPYGKTVEIVQGKYISVLLQKHILNGMFIPYNLNWITIDISEQKVFNLIYDPENKKFSIKE